MDGNGWIDIVTNPSFKFVAVFAVNFVLQLLRLGLLEVSLEAGKF